MIDKAGSIVHIHTMTKELDMSAVENCVLALNKNETLNAFKGDKLKTM
jgi:hypothetical protein